MHEYSILVTFFCHVEIWKWDIIADLNSCRINIPLCPPSLQWPGFHHWYFNLQFWLRILDAEALQSKKHAFDQWGFFGSSFNKLYKQYIYHLELVHVLLRLSLNSIFPSTSSDPLLAADLGVLNSLIPSPVKLSLPWLSGLLVFFLWMLLPPIGSPGMSLHLPKLLVHLPVFNRNLLMSLDFHGNSNTNSKWDWTS